MEFKLHTYDIQDLMIALIAYRANNIIEETIIAYLEGFLKE